MTTCEDRRKKVLHAYGQFLDDKLSADRLTIVLYDNKYLDENFKIPCYEMDIIKSNVQVECKSCHKKTNDCVFICYDCFKELRKSNHLLEYCIPTGIRFKQDFSQ